MRLFSFLAAAVMLTTGLAGCIEFFTPQDPGEDAPVDGSSGATDDPGANGGDGGSQGEPDPGPGTDPGGSGSDPGTTTPTEPEPEPASEPATRSSVAPPLEQREDSVSDLDRPGEYALLPRGPSNSNVKTNVPTWAKDAVWRFESNTPSISQRCNFNDKVTQASDTFFDVPVAVLTRTKAACGDNPSSSETGIKRGHADLMKINDNGYVEHELVFPLEDGKKWRYVNTGNSTVDAVLDYVPAYLWDGQAVAAWHVTLDYAGAARIEKWYGIAAKNYLHEEVWAIIQGAPVLITETNLKSYSG